MMDATYSEREIEEAFRFLEHEKLIFFLDGYFALYNNNILVQRRKKGNEKAVGQLRIAAKVANLLSRFPYVRGVAVSGSLSKNFADEESDIDFFIITAKDRLWLARTLMHLFKKLTYLVGKQHWFCMNYYVDEAGLEIKEKNIYTAVEVVTALPLRGDVIFQDLIAANEWTKTFFSARVTEINTSKKIRKGLLKPLAENIFNNKFGNWLNDRLMEITIRRWAKKTENKRKNRRGILMGMDAGKHYSKPEPKYFQEKVLYQFHLKMEQLMHKLEPYPALRAV